MRRPVAVLMLASMTAIGALALVSFGLSHGQAMKQKATFLGLAGSHIGQGNHMESDDNMSIHMNVTQHMHGTCEEMHYSANMTEHMRGIP